MTVLVALALVLATALFGMLTRLIPDALALWREQVAAVASEVAHLQASPLPRSHRRPARVVRVTVRAYKAVTS